MISVLAPPMPTNATQPDLSADLYKTMNGEFWHRPARAFTSGSSYVSTACGRRLGRWNLMPAQPAAAIREAAICIGCRRKAADR
ncbi:hypothetical protein [Nocardioides sp. NPDC127503]|uniref:hypothetical protein n=1 Tax=Nocardioides sp. NPDC127503 TaxID=3154516 RepID=UPI00332DB82C